MEHKKLPQNLVHNAGVFYVCHRLSQMGWNATPTKTRCLGPSIVVVTRGASAWTNTCLPIPRPTFVVWSRFASGFRLSRPG
jgi:hypothetical protein